MESLLALRDEPQTFEPATHGGVDQQVADTEHDAADDRRIDGAADGDGLAGGRLELLPQASAWASSIGTAVVRETASSRCSRR